MVDDRRDLAEAGRILARVRDLLGQEEKLLRDEFGDVRRSGDHSAGSPAQTLQGINQMHNCAQDALQGIAVALGYIELGMEDEARRWTARARRTPVGIPSGAERMRRPLGASTIEALELARTHLGGFFRTEAWAMSVDIVLLSPQATYPPDDWREYDRRHLHKPE
ncbi:hypothetical protein GTY65_39535 [Streptomyces sp. SID8379]|uniref:hypothetical protein n=1 Tax=unclassified Streptomyces TaxID=2593676 RepID=UPI00037E3417|nr:MULTISPECIES: hypothetical protein [unclassified Streptomyces]MYW70106.1 hypothetical protein [Streptomyces sp. SID8379]